MTEAAPPITGFFRGWRCFFNWEYTPPRGSGDRTAYRTLLKRMALSETAALTHQFISRIADILLGLALCLHYDDWLTDHGIRMDRHTGNLWGFLCFVGIFFAAHGVVSYFQALAWFLMRGEGPGAGS